MKVIRHRVPKGRLIGWKKAHKSKDKWLRHRVLIKLAIPASAHVIKAKYNMDGKCRASKAKVLAVYQIECNSRYIRIQGKRLYRGPFKSGWDTSFKYRVGAIVIPDHFDDNRYECCSGGIHFYLGTRGKRKALDY